MSQVSGFTGVDYIVCVELSKPAKKVFQFIFDFEIQKDSWYNYLMMKNERLITVCLFLYIYHEFGSQFSQVYLVLCYMFLFQNFG